MKELLIDYITLAYLQINNSTLACDFSDFHKAVEKVLGRSVWTHQFASKDILIEKGMYIHNSENPTTNLCNEVIKELINSKFLEFCALKQETPRPNSKSVVEK